MAIDRRKFMKIAGLAAAGAAASPAARLLATDENVAIPDAGITAAEQAPAGLPQEHPLTAGRWAMVVDLRKCEEYNAAHGNSCTHCMDACNHTHNVPDIPADQFGGEEIKWIWKEHFGHAFHNQRHPFQREHLEHLPIPVLCNHCDNPPCVRVCPTQATFKREEDGIVMMDWHRCIGCRYCVVACPYGSRSFNWRDPRPFIDELNPDFPTRTRGVVEKCTFCEERLARGEGPACVEACPAGALTFGDLEGDDPEFRNLLANNFSLRRKPELGTQPEVYYIGVAGSHGSDDDSHSSEEASHD